MFPSPSARIFLRKGCRLLSCRPIQYNKFYPCCVDLANKAGFHRPPSVVYVGSYISHITNPTAYDHFKYKELWNAYQLKMSASINCFLEITDSAGLLNQRSHQPITFDHFQKGKFTKICSWYSRTIWPLKVHTWHSDKKHRWRHYINIPL